MALQGYSVSRRGDRPKPVKLRKVRITSASEQVIGSAGVAVKTERGIGEYWIYEDDVAQAMALLEDPALITAAQRQWAADKDHWLANLGRPSKWEEVQHEWHGPSDWGGTFVALNHRSPNPFTEVVVLEETQPPPQTEDEQRANITAEQLGRVLREALLGLQAQQQRSGK